jgi:glutathione reductase (NADPH)
METFDFDLIIIGGGSGGSATSKRAAEYGAKVCIIDRGVERDEHGNRVGAGIGGTCVNVGCVPKKIMWYAAHHRELLHGSTATAAGFSITGVDSANVGFDWAAMKAKRDAEVARLNGIYERGWISAGVTVLKGFASLASAHEVKVMSRGQDGSEHVQVVTARYILVAVGGYPRPLPVPGGELAITSDGFFDLEATPKKALVIGAGYIAAELSGILHALGTDTSLLFRGESIMRHDFDDYVVNILMKEMEAHGPKLLGMRSPTALVREADGTITCVSAHTGPDGAVSEVREGGFDVVLSAIGRATAVAGLNLEAVGVEVDPRSGLVKVDEYQRTSVESVLAVGDCTPGMALTPVAIAAGRRLADRLFGGEPRARLEYDKVPTVVFSHPPIGTIGLTEAQARAKHGAASVRVQTASFFSMLYVFNDPASKVRTGLKLVLAGPEERVVGLHIIGPSSDEMLQGFAVAVKMGATRRDFEAVVAIHPTISEELVTFGGWGQTADKKRVLLPPQLDGSASGGGGVVVGGGADAAAAAEPKPTL